MNPATVIPKIASLLLLCFVAITINAQQPIPVGESDSIIARFSTGNPCSNDMILAQLRKNPAFVAAEEKRNFEIRTASRTLDGDTITLPVVVHIINSNPSSISDQFVIDGIQDLNDAFSKSGAYSASAGADTKIRFCISKKDPDGGNTTGITRTKSFFGDHLNMDIEDARLKNLIQWNPAKYINIWLITSIDAESYADFICGNWYRLGVGGYATLPPGGGPLDGIVITGFGTLLAHEMGHYLGLYHTFQGGCFNNNCLENGDWICDTPPDNTVRPSSGCNFPSNSCNTDTLSNYSWGAFPQDVPDQISNFMDYGNSGCSDRFTQGQAEWMHAAILTQRSGLLEDECTQPCTENIVAGFLRNNAYPVPGDVINFTNFSTGATQYEWLVDDIPVAPTPDYSRTFNAVGKTKITLKAYNTPGCFAAYSDYIIVTCGVTARFYTNKKTIASMLNIYTDSILFTNTSVNGVSYIWLMSNSAGMNEQEVGTNTNLLYVFPTPATYHIRLIATNGACSDTTGFYHVPVLDPTTDGYPFAISVLCYDQNKVRVRFCLANVGFAPIPVNTPVNFYNADPRIPGAIKLSPTFSVPTAVPGNCSMCFTHILDVAYHGIEKIYIVFNDIGTTIPIVLPNTTLVETNYFNNIQNSQATRTFYTLSICQGQNYAGYTIAGTYIDTFPSINNGCDSIRTLNLSIRPVYNTTITTSICSGQNYAGHTTSGTFVDVYSAANGCDSTRTLHLTVKPTFTTSLAVTICQGQNYYGHTTAGIYTDTYSAANGCDSTRTVQLTVLPVFNTFVAATICQGQNYAGHTASGTYVDSYFAVNGCDSTRTLQLTVNPVKFTTITTSICQGQNYAGHIASGTYIDVYSGVNGCDSTRTLHLAVNPVKFTTVTTAICEGENYFGHTTTGVYVDVYPTVFGCDSTRTVFLTVKPLVYSTVSATICEGYDYAGHTESGNYVDVYTGVNGCDSIRTLLLTVNPKKYTEVNAAICTGESYFAGGQFQTSSGVYTDIKPTHLGCDSIITTNLTVHPLPQPNLGVDRGVCIGYSLTLNPGNFSSYAWQNGSTNQHFITNIVGEYFVRVSNSFGCFAADTMKLVAIHPLPADYLPDDSSLCKGNILQVEIPGYVNYAWSNGTTLNRIEIKDDGEYKLSVVDQFGCPGVDSLNVFFYENCLIVQVPNAFTPNNDGRNDVFKPLIPAPVTNYVMQVYNRWGQKIFETQNVDAGWNGLLAGQAQASGAYVYQISLKDYLGREVRKSGTVVLIR